MVSGVPVGLAQAGVRMPRAPLVLPWSYTTRLVAAWPRLFSTPRNVLYVWVAASLNNPRNLVDSPIRLRSCHPNRLHSSFTPLGGLQVHLHSHAFASPLDALLQSARTLSIHLTSSFLLCSAGTGSAIWRGRMCGLARRQITGYMSMVSTGFVLQFAQQLAAHKIIQSPSTTGAATSCCFQLWAEPSRRPSRLDAISCI